MTTKDLRKYAEEKGFPKRFTDDIVQRIESDTGEDIDEMSFYELCAYIDRSAEYWSGFRKFLEYLSFLSFVDKTSTNSINQKKLCQERFNQISNCIFHAVHSFALIYSGTRMWSIRPYFIASWAVMV